jgi:small conductance mechanosensitive channel
MFLKAEHCLIKFAFIIAILFSFDVVAAETNPANTEADNSDAQTSIEQEDGLLLETEALVEDIQTKSKEAREKFTLFNKSTGQERSMIGIQLLDLGAKIRKSLDELILNIDALKEQNIDVEKLVTVAKEKIKEQSASIISKIKLVNNLIDKEEKKREKTEIAELFVLEQDINQGLSIIANLNKALFENLKRMKLMEMDASKDLKYLKKELQKLAKNTSTLIKLNDIDISQLKEGIKKAGENNSQEMESELNALEEREAGLVVSLRSAINLMGKLKLETSDYNLQLIRSVGQIDEALLDKKVVLGLVEQWSSDAKDWLVENGVSLFAKVFTIIFILFLFKIFAMLSERLVRKAIISHSSSVSKLLQNFLENMVSKLVMLIGILVALGHLGVQIGPLLAGLGVVGFIVGFALQDTLSNFASGLMILFYKPYDVGDVIEAAGQKGTVSEMNLVSTTIYTFDNQMLIVPNNKIWGDIIKNVTSQEKRRVDFEFSVNLSADIDIVENILVELIKSHELILDDPEPVVKLHRIDKTSQDFIARPWVKTEDYWQVYWDMTRSVKQRFDKEEISRPASRHDVELIQTS